MRIRYVIDTHVHADHLSVGPDLARTADAEYILYSGAVVGFDFKGVNDGDILDLGNDAITIWHTPGHTPERALAFIDESAFVAHMMEEIPPRPENAEANRAANSGFVVAN